MTVWQKINNALKWLGHKLLGPIGVLVLVVLAIIASAAGFKNIQIGGLIGMLLGKQKKDGPKAIDVANSIPKNRVDDKGVLIPIGKADDKGITQAPVVAIEQPGLFSDPSVVKFTPPGETTPIEVTLPSGVSASDVEHVVVIKPQEYVVTVKDNSNIKAHTIDDLLKKFGTK